MLCKSSGELKGCHHWSEDGIPDDCVLASGSWQDFLGRPPKQTIPFLISRLSLTNNIAVEVTPWGKATDGAMAVYAMEHILHTNWFQCDSRFTRLAKYAVIIQDEPRFVEPFMLGDMAARKELSDFFLQALASWQPPSDEPPSSDK